MKTVAGQQLLKDKIAVTLPIKMTPDEVKSYPLIQAKENIMMQRTCGISMMPHMKLQTMRNSLCQKPHKYSMSLTLAKSRNRKYL